VKKVVEGGDMWEKHNVVEKVVLSDENIRKLEYRDVENWGYNLFTGFLRRFFSMTEDLM